jgi:putative ABC transport system permease protein
VFYLRYIRSELVRRRTRTLLTVLGLGLGVALVIAITGLSRGLDDAQSAALDPLASIGTDLTVTRAPQQDTGGFGPGGGAGGRDLVEANQSAVTDLSKLGKPGDRFVHDFFLPGTQLTFPASQTAKIASLSGVGAVSTGLVLSAVHQQGVVPKIVAKIRTGGERVRIRRQITPPTAAEFAQIQSCLQKAGVGAPSTPQSQPQQGFRAGGPGGGGVFATGAARKCLPKRMREFVGTFTTPEQTLSQIVDPPQTNIESSTYTIAGVDDSNRDIGLVTPSLVTTGSFFSGDGGKEALVSQTYAKRHALKVGSKLDLNGTSFVVVGLVKPSIGGQSADVYVPLARLQKLAGENGLVNVALVRADSSSDVGNVQKQIESTLGTEAQVASAKDVADSISGSLVDAADLSHSLGLVLAIVAAAAAFLLAALLTLSSIGKRVREIGTLKALGWSQRLVVRQVAGECLATGIAGGVVGIVLGILALLAVDAFGPELSAHSTTGGSSAFGLGQVFARTASTTVSLNPPLSAALVALGFVLALAGGLIAGGAGALRAARLRPADALRQVE